VSTRKWRNNDKMCFSKFMQVHLQVAFLLSLLTVGDIQAKIRSCYFFVLFCFGTSKWVYFFVSMHICIITSYYAAIVFLVETQEKVLHMCKREYFIEVNKLCYLHQMEYYSEVTIRILIPSILYSFPSGWC
jgi:hypothetical protein